MRMRLFMMLAALGVAGGCQSPSTPKAMPAATRFSAAVDPCSLRLDEIRSALLLYCARNFALPETLSELSSPDGKPLELSCPVSRKAYLYDPAGLPMGERRLLIVVDPEPSHDGRRWGITIADPPAGAALVTGIVLISEPEFLGLGR